MNKHSIRHAGIKDVKSIKEIELAAAKRFKGLGLIDHLLGHHFDQALLKTLIIEKQVWLAEFQLESSNENAALPPKTIGFAIATVLGHLAYLEELDVLPEFGRQGVGRALVAAAADWAREQRFRHLTLSTFSHVPWNAPFYRKLGFEVLPEPKWESELQEIRILEDKLGLPIDQRVFMRLKL